MYVDANAPQQDVDVQVGLACSWVVVGLQLGCGWVAVQVRLEVQEGAAGYWARMLVGGCWDVTCRV